MGTTPPHDHPPHADATTTPHCDEPPGPDSRPYSNKRRRCRSGSSEAMEFDDPPKKKARTAKSVVSVRRGAVPAALAMYAVSKWIPHTSERTGPKSLFHPSRATMMSNAGDNPFRNQFVVPEEWGALSVHPSSQQSKSFDGRRSEPPLRGDDAPRVIGDRCRINFSEWVARPTLRSPSCSSSSNNNNNTISGNAATPKSVHRGIILPIASLADKATHLPLATLFPTQQELDVQPSAISDRRRPTFSDSTAQFPRTMHRVEPQERNGSTEANATMRWRKHDIPKELSVPVLRSINDARAATNWPAMNTFDNDLYFLRPPLVLDPAYFRDSRVKPLPTPWRAAAKIRPSDSGQGKDLVKRQSSTLEEQPSKSIPYNSSLIQSCALQTALWMDEVPRPRKIGYRTTSSALCVIPINGAKAAKDTLPREGISEKKRVLTFPSGRVAERQSSALEAQQPSKSIPNNLPLCQSCSLQTTAWIDEVPRRRRIDLQTISFALSVIPNNGAQAAKDALSREDVAAKQLVLSSPRRHYKNHAGEPTILIPSAFVHVRSPVAFAPKHEMRLALPLKVQRASLPEPKSPQLSALSSTTSRGTEPSSIQPGNPGSGSLAPILSSILHIAGKEAARAPSHRILRNTIATYQTNVGMYASSLRTLLHLNWHMLQRHVLLVHVLFRAATPDGRTMRTVLGKAKALWSERRVRKRQRRS